MILIGDDQRTGRKVAYNPRPGLTTLGGIMFILIGLMLRGWWLILAVVGALAIYQALRDICSWMRAMR